MRSLIPALLVALIATAFAGPAAACKVGHAAVIFLATPAAHEAPHLSTLAKVRLQFEPPRAPTAEPTADYRGVLLGSAQVLEVVRGPSLPTTVPVYLEVISSCSSWPKGALVTGYVVGQLKVDGRGPYLSLAEHNGLTAPWR